MTPAAPALQWYRSPVDKSALDQLALRSNLRGAWQAGAHLLAFLITGGLCLVAFERQAFWLLAGALFLHGAVASFMVNASHELVHGTVFAWAPANRLFLRIFSFFVWENPRRFWASHKEHHKYTLHPPADMEEVLPKTLRLRDFIEQSVFDPRGMFQRIRRNCRLSLGRYNDEWERHLFEGQACRAGVIRWSRELLAVHGLIAVVALAQGWWLVPVLVSLAPTFGGGFFFLCNNTQHAGLTDRVADFRVCCRTIDLNPVLRFFYWHMNFHTEHHMYPSVPCYRLRDLHELIKADLPPTPNGLLPTWQQILAGQRERQQQRPAAEPIPAPRPEPAAALQVLECTVCGFVYDERLGLPDEGIAPGTPWRDVPDDWRCPDCGIGKSDFKPLIF